MPKQTRSNSAARQERRHNPLGEEYSPTAPHKQPRKKRKQSHGEEPTQDAYVDSRSSRRILDLGQDLAAEDEASRPAKQSSATSTAFSLESRIPIGAADDDEEAAEPGEYDDEEAWGSDFEAEEVDADPKDLEAFNRFNPSFDPSTLLQPKTDSPGDEAQGTGTNLADLILEKIAAHEAQQEGAENDQPRLQGGGDPDDAVELPGKVVEVYSQVGMLLSRYKSGKLPKPFKILPTLPQWDILLSITRPDSWTPNAVYEATRLFSSSRVPVARAFYTDVLLPRIRDDIHETKKLNVHLYKSLKKALYKPKAFFLGLLFPLVSSGTCTQREAEIAGSVIAKVSIPVLESAAALTRICEIAADQMMDDAESAGACNIFIRIFLQKKYALPFQTVDAVVFHFLRFKSVQQSTNDAGAGDDVSMSETGGFPGKKGAGDSKLPVLWHQCLLVFAQRYKNEITEDQREALLDLLLVREHRQISAEIRRELLEGRGKGVMKEPNAGLGGDDTMIDV